MSILIKNGRIITAEQDYNADIYIDNGIIRLIGIDLELPADKIIDASGKYVIPGGIDVHTHLDMPFGGTMSSDDFETGTRAAAFGGTTCVVDFATQSRGENLLDTLEIWHQKARNRATIDYGFHMIITDLPDAKINDLDVLVSEGVTSFKLFLAYPNSLMVDDTTIFKTLQRASKLGALVCMHAENGSVIDLLVRKAVSAGNVAPRYHALTRPTIAEAEAVNRTIAIARMAEAPVYIVHLSSSDALDEVESARASGIPVLAETCPQYMFLSLDDMGKPGFEDAKLVFTPPVREKWNQEKLWAGLKKNSIQVVATDHCPFNFNGQKDAGIEVFTKIPNGGPGIEHRMQLLFDGGVNEKRITLNRWVEVMSTNPAKIFGMYPRKGAIAPGSDADIVIWDPEKELTLSARTHHMRVDYSMYEGRKVKGNAELVISGGEIIVENNEFHGKAGRGKYIKRAGAGYSWF